MISILRGTGTSLPHAQPAASQHLARSVHLASVSVLDVLKTAGGGSGKHGDEYPVTPLHLLDACASRMEAYKNSHALAEETLTKARDQAADGEAKWMAGQPTSVLDGIPLAVKGNFALKDIPMNTARTQLLRDNVPSECASLVKKLSGAGSVFSGKTDVNEFGIGAVEMTVQPEAVLSTWYSTDDKSSEARFVGGGTAYLGVVGLKTSKGRLSRQGLLSVAGGLETPGVVARTVSDAALLLAILQDKDTGRCMKVAKLLDTAADQPVQLHDALPALLGFSEGQHPLQGLRVGVVELSSHGVHISESQTEAFKQGISCLEKAGAKVEKIELPDLLHSVGAMYHLATAEMLSGSNSFKRALKELGLSQANTSEEVYEEVCSILSATRSRGLELSGQSDMTDDKASSVASTFADKLKQVDIILMPSAPGAAPTVAEASQWGNDQLLSIDAINAPASLGGAPALTVPIALTSAEGLPLGLQVLAGPSQEALMLAVGHVLEMGAQSEFRGSLLAPLHAPAKGKAPISTV
ncbi:hypothetical protein WJX75_002887 [Coccomyxa subellipsoidea]|uniref:Amidase domain-containing protein n=1 Tax=Coccomyxa subellipsoidea TaxID=248742 RepID=A0ABR2Z279_9CHLO